MVDHTEDPDLQTIYITSEDQEKPATNLKYPRLYGHHLCPFVEKVRLGFAAKGVKYQRADVDLSRRTKWHLAINEGKIPILELPDGTILIESKIILEYLEETYPDQGVKTLPTDPKERALLRLDFPLIESLIPDFYAIFIAKGKNPDDFPKLRAKLQKLEDYLNNKAKDSVFAWGTDHVTQLDFHFYPHLVRIAFLKDSAYHSVYYEKVGFEDFPRIQKYLNDI